MFVDFSAIKYQLPSEMSASQANILFFYTYHYQEGFIIYGHRICTDIIKIGGVQQSHFYNKIKKTQKMIFSGQNLQAATSKVVRAKINGVGIAAALLPKRHAIRLPESQDKSNRFSYENKYQFNKSHVISISSAGFRLRKLSGTSRSA